MHDENRSRLSENASGQQCRWTVERKMYRARGNYRRRPSSPEDNDSSREEVGNEKRGKEWGRTAHGCIEGNQHNYDTVCQIQPSKRFGTGRGRYALPS